MLLESIFSPLDTPGRSTGVCPVPSCVMGLAMRCPACRLPLLTLEIKEIELDYCADDMGVWFDEGEIETLLDSTTPVLTVDPKDARGKRRCPRCDARMLLHFPVPQLELDMCPNGDGIWFDAGEVEQLATAMKDKQGLEHEAHLDEIFVKLNSMLGGQS